MLALSVAVSLAAQAPSGSDRADPLVIGGEVRLRWDGYTEPVYAGGSDEGFVSSQIRAKVHAGWQATDWLKLFAEVTAGAENGRPRVRPADETAPELTQAFAEISIPTSGRTWSARVGRQELSYGRFVTTRDGTNLRRTFDGLRVMGRVEGVDVDLALARPTLQRSGAFDDRWSSSESLVAATLSARLGPGTISAFLIERRTDRISFARVSGPERRRSRAIRYAGLSGRLDWDGQATLQTGEVRPAGRAIPIRAAGFSAEAGWTSGPGPRAPRIAVRVDGAMGDGAPEDRRLGTFDLPYPNLTIISDAALFAPRNLVSLQGFAVLQPDAELTATVGSELLWRWTRHDAIYSPAGAIIAAPDRSSRSLVAFQPYVRAKWQVRSGLEMRAAGVWTRARPVLHRGKLGSQLFFSLSATASF